MKQKVRAGRSFNVQEDKDVTFEYINLLREGEFKCISIYSLNEALDNLKLGNLKEMQIMNIHIHIFQAQL